MLPLIPALILLLLQGPSNFERLTMDARLPAALEVIHRQLLEPGNSQLSEREEQALASLIASGKGAQLTQALLSFLWQEEEVRTKPTFRDCQDLESTSITSPPTSRRQDGYADCRRSRDGPIAS